MPEPKPNAPCPHGEHPAVCVECFEGVPPERPAPRWEKSGREFRAIHDGTCPTCGENIYSDFSLIQRWEKEDTTKYTHSWCGVPDA